MNGRSVLAWAFALVPLVGIVELALHLKQTSDVVPDADWNAARDAMKSEVKPEDLVLFAPFWADPIGREHFGDELAGIDREARSGEDRFPRAFEVSIRGKHRPEIEGWKKLEEKHYGKVTVGLYENPAPAKVLSDFVRLANPQSMTVTRVEGSSETPCPFQRGAGQPGGLGVPQGPAVPGDKFQCASGGYVGVAVLHALDHHPHLCLFASAPGPSGALRIKAKVTFGTTLHGHTGIQWVNERTPAADKIFVSFASGGRPLGEAIHKVGAGWTYFDFPTPELAGKTGELVADVTSTAPTRSFCFEADTR